MKKTMNSSNNKSPSISKKQTDIDADTTYDNDSYQEKHHNKLNAKRNQQDRDKARKLKRG